MTGRSQLPSKAILDFLVSAFNEKELEFFASSIDPSLLNSIPSGQQLDYTALQFLNAVQRRGLSIQTLCSHLAEARPHRAAELGDPALCLPLQVRSALPNDVPDTSLVPLGLGNALDTQLQRQRVALTGLSGSGKSQAALWYGRRWLESPEGAGQSRAAWWIDARRERFLQAFADLAIWLGLPQLPTLPLEARCERVRTALQLSPGQKLLLLDGVDDFRLIDPWLPGTGSMCVLATTRVPGNDLTWTWLGLPPASPEAAQAWLCEDHPSLATDHAMAALASLLSPLRIALVTARRLLKDRIVRPSSILQILTSTDVTAPPAELNLKPLFDQAAAQLGGDPTDQNARALLTQLAGLAATPAPRDLLEALLSPVKLDFALRRLVDVGLVGFSEECGVTMHSLVLAWGRPLAARPEQIAADLGATLVNLVTEGQRARLRSWVPHLRHLTSALPPVSDDSAWWVPLRLAEHLEEQGLFQEALEVLAGWQSWTLTPTWRSRFVVQRARALLRGWDAAGALAHLVPLTGQADLEPDLRASASYYLGRALALQGAHQEAATAYRQALIGLPVPSQDPSSRARILQALARSLAAMGSPEQAMSVFQEAKAALSDLQDPTAARIAYGQGVALAACGRLEEAVPHLEEALRLHRQLIGAHHPHTHATQAELGLARACLGESPLEAEEAIAALKRDGGHPQAVLRLQERYQALPPRG